VNKSTRDNLETAMRSEAFTYAKYMLFAEGARKTGNPELAQLLEKTAKQELGEHFAEEAALAEIVRSDVDNLQDAIASESYGIESMYRDFAEQASLRATKPPAISLKRFAMKK
jgi:rubrerythrin